MTCWTTRRRGSIPSRNENGPPAATTATWRRITARLRPVSAFSADFKDAELLFSIAGVPVVNRIFVVRSEGEFIVAQ
jgi:hypothetical protein